MLAVAALGLLSSSPAKAQAANPSAAKRTAATILVVGDSLSAEYGLARGTGWVSLLEARLQERQSPARVVNASISGDTTSGGRSRLPGLLRRHNPTHVVLELGGNDALRGLDLRMTQANLMAMARAALQADAKVTLVGMQVPPNYGAQYTRAFAQTFVDVAKSTGSALVPFFLKGVADAPDAASLFQADRIHPNEQAQPTLLNNVWPVLWPQLQ